MTTPTATPSFSRTPRRVEHWPTPKMHSWCKIQHGDVETGSFYKLGCEQARDAISSATSWFSSTPSSSRTLSNIEIGLHCTCMAYRIRVTSKPEVSGDVT
jgi:hypothetical protein